MQMILSCQTYIENCGKYWKSGCGIVTAFENTALSRNQPHLQALAPSNQEEANTRVFLHAMGMASNKLVAF